jgi:hypothetical protein
MSGSVPKLGRSEASWLEYVAGNGRRERLGQTLVKASSAAWRHKGWTTALSISELNLRRYAQWH